MMATPLISIITVTFNAAECVGKTMRSVSEQCFRDFEHIVADGASTDNTLDIVRQFPDVIVHSERDSGIYDGMNKGLRLARGRYLLFLNAGDTFPDSGTLQLYADAIASGNADIIYGDTDIVDGSGRFLRHRHLSAPALLTRESFRRGMLICHQAFMVRRAIAPAYDMRYAFSADYDWTIRCIEATEPGRCINLHAVVAHYLDEGATEKHKLRSLRERMFVMAEHYGWWRTIGAHLSFIPRAIMRKIGLKRK